MRRPSMQPVTSDARPWWTCGQGRGTANIEGPRRRVAGCGTAGMGDGWPEHSTLGCRQGGSAGWNIDEEVKIEDDEAGPLDDEHSTERDMIGVVVVGDEEQVEEVVPIPRTSMTGG